MRYLRKALIPLAALAVIAGAAACTPRPTNHAAATSCSATVTDIGGRQVAVHADSNIAPGTAVTLEFWGNGALLGSYSTSVGYSGTIDLVLGVPLYPYYVDYVGRVLHAGRVLCQATYHDPGA